MATSRKSKSSGTALTPVLNGQENISFRKTNEAIGLRLREGRLSLLSRKILNVMFYHAQNLTLGQNAPIDSPVNRKYFWVPLSEVAKDSAYDSKDTALLKEHIEELQNIKLHMEDEHQWTSERLVSSVKLVNPSGLNKRGGMLWFGYAFPPEVFELIKNPGTYTKLSIYYQGMFRAGASLALYEICRRYATNPSHKTSSESYEYWHGALTGTPVGTELSPYKYFKRDVLKPALAEINATTDIECSLIEHKRGRKVEMLQFEVRLNKQPSLDFPIPPVINSALIEALEELGFSAHDAKDICAANSVEKIESTLAMVHKRMRAAGSAPLDAPAAYFRWALKNAHNTTVRALAQEVSPPKLETTNEQSNLERFLTARALDAINVYKELPSSEAQSVMLRFRASHVAKNVRTSKGLEHPMVRSLFGRWYALELWGEPTAEALDMFLQQMSIEAPIN